MNQTGFHSLQLFFLHKFDILLDRRLGNMYYLTHDYKSACFDSIYGHAPAVARFVRREPSHLLTYKRSPLFLS